MSRINHLFSSVRCTTACLAVAALSIGSGGIQAQSLSNADLRDIDRLANRLERASEELHDEFHEHLEGVKHSEKIETDVTRLEKIAKSLHQFAHNADRSERSMQRLQADTNDLIRLAFQVRRTVDFAAPWAHSRDARVGIGHMRDATREVTTIAMAIDRFLPVDTDVIDGQLVVLEAAVKELHDEFHEHLEGYEVSEHLDRDLEALEKDVEHIHELAHGKSFATINLTHILNDIRDAERTTNHVEELFTRQARIGVRSRDYIGIEHSRDAITDVLASAELVRHMIYKAEPRLRPHRNAIGRDRDIPTRDRLDRRPVRDRLDNLSGDRFRRLPQRDRLDNLSDPRRDRFIDLN